MKTVKIPLKDVNISEFSLDAADIFWRDSAAIRIDNFRQESNDHHPKTTVRLFYNRTGIFLHYEVSDQYILATHTEPNSNVFEDSCVEFFIKPFGAEGYFNFEFNCIGTVLTSYILDNTINEHGLFKEFTKLSNESIGSIQKLTTFTQPIYEEIKIPVEWKLAAFIPFNLFLEYSNLANIQLDKPWACNFYKCADKSSHPHWASWNPVSELNFHNVNDFGKLYFDEDS